MKLLIVMPTQARGGVEEHALAIARAAVSQGWQVSVACPKRLETQGLIADFESAGVRYWPLDISETELYSASNITELIQTLPLRLLAWIEKPWHFIQLMGALLRDRPDAVMLNLAWADKGFTTLLACALLNQPVAVVFHLIPWRLPLAWPQLKLYEWMGSRRQAWIGISENNRQLIAETFQRPLAKIIRIYNGTAATHQLAGEPTDEPAGEPIDEPAAELTTSQQLFRQQLRQSLNLPDNSVILITVARLVSQKGHDTLIPAIPHLLKQFPTIHFVWVGSRDRPGSDPRQPPLEDLLESYGVRSSVSLLGHSGRVGELLQAADLFVLPTHFEGFPFALLEAMAAGVPAIATAVNGIPELIEHGVHGLLTRRGDSCDLLETLRWALVHPHEMQQMASRAMQRARDFSQEAMTSKTLHVLSSIS